MKCYRFQYIACMVTFLQDIKINIWANKYIASKLKTSALSCQPLCNLGSRFIMRARALIDGHGSIDIDLQNKMGC